jgi:hypothetical protein
MFENNFINKIDSNQVISGIYKIENLINHKVYIGQSVNIYKRWRYHKWSTFNKKSTVYNYSLYRAIRKYGIENFSFEIIKETYDLNYWEIFLIRIFNSTNPKYGYNVAEGGYLSTRNINSKTKILCINTKEIKYSEEWSRLKYHIQFGSNKHIFYFNNVEIRKIKGLFFLKSNNLTKKDIQFYFDNLNMIESEYDKWYRNTRIMGGKVSVEFTEEHIKNMIKSKKGKSVSKRKFIKCIESEEVYSSREWVKMGYHDVCEVANNKQNSCHNLHFEYTTKEEYENFKNVEDKTDYELKRKENEQIREKIIYAKCIETDEIHSNQEWIKLGYGSVISILNTTKECHGKHFIKVIRLENGEFQECLNDMKIEGISIENGKLNKIDKLKIQTKDLTYVKCVETNDIASIKEWKDLGYYSIYDVFRNKSKSCKDKHFVKVTKDEYIEYKNNKFNKLDFEERNKIIKEIIYAKCIESGEIYDAHTWYKLGYNNIYNVLNNVNESCKNLHFIQVSKLDFDKYNENCSDKEVRINKRKELTKSKEILYAKCIETNEVHSNSEWKLLGFVGLLSSIHIRSNYYNLHFIQVDKSEYEDYKKLNFDFYVNKKFYDEYLKPKEIIYAKCVETSEIRTTTEWWKLGYNHVKSVLNGERERNKGLHFIKSTKEEYESYLKQLFSKSA